MPVIRMKIQKKNEGRVLRNHYTTICHYCGFIFKSNRKTARFCPCGHRQMNKKYGPRINPTAFNRYGVLFNADELLTAFYKAQGLWKDGWCKHRCHLELEAKFGYEGPLPDGAELMLVGRYLLKRVQNENNGHELHISVKPFVMYNDYERANMVFCKGEFTQFTTHEYLTPKEQVEIGSAVIKTVETLKHEEEMERRPIEAYIFQGVKLRNRQRSISLEPEQNQNQNPSANELYLKAIKSIRSVANSGVGRKL